MLATPDRSLPLRLAAALILGGLLAGPGPAAASAGVNWDDYQRYLSPTGASAEKRADRSSDDEFLESLISAEEAVKPAAKSGGSPGYGIRVNTEYTYSNRKPGYLLLQDQDADYEATGTRTGATVNLGASGSLQASLTTKNITESGSDPVDLQKIELSSTWRPVKGTSLVAHLRRLDLPAASGAAGSAERNEYGLDLSTKSGAARFGINAAHKVYAATRASFLAPAEYDRISLLAGYTEGELCTELMPAYEIYRDDGNTKWELATSVFYYPRAMTDWTFDVHGQYAGFASETGDAGSRVYFSPSRENTFGAGLDYATNLAKGVGIDLGLTLDREGYTLDGTATSYYVASWQGSIDWRILDAASLRFSYDGTLSQTDNFPYSQNMRGGLEFRF